MCTEANEMIRTSTSMLATGPVSATSSKSTYLASAPSLCVKCGSTVANLGICIVLVPFWGSNKDTLNCRYPGYVRFGGVWKCAHKS